ncbi:nucleotide-diphospho-sugar transferase [Cyathus striatus]|nr:nucleotide-diphospho-sugar transferase [Cyathus striatus]
MAFSSVFAAIRVRNRIFAFFCLVFFALTYLLFTNSSISSPLSFIESNARPNGVIIMLLAPNRLIQATKALMNAEDRFNRRLKYPYVLFSSEDEVSALTNEIRAKIHYITEGRATFATTTKESWDVPTDLDKARVEASLQNIGFRLGYRSMCRFYSGFFWRHPALAPYDWFWRLDTDIVFHCEVPYDPIQRLIESNALYGFVQASADADFVQPSLASNVSHFMSQNRDLISRDANHGFVWKDAASVERAFTGIAGIDDWTRMCMYNNFEISHRNVWESTLYTKFFEYLDKAGGFFYERWGDAPVHSFGLAMSLRKDQAFRVKSSICTAQPKYQHQGLPYECPQELDRCTCEREGVAASMSSTFVVAA